MNTLSDSALELSDSKDYYEKEHQQRKDILTKNAHSFLEDIIELENNSISSAASKFDAKTLLEQDTSLQTYEKYIQQQQKSIEKLTSLNEKIEEANQAISQLEQENETLELVLDYKEAKQQKKMQQSALKRANLSYKTLLGMEIDLNSENEAIVYFNSNKESPVIFKMNPELTNFIDFDASSFLQKDEELQIKNETLLPKILCILRNKLIK